MRSPRPLLVLAVVAVLASATLTACGKRSENAGGTHPTTTTKLTLLLDHPPDANHAGIYAAGSTGEFGKEGLDVAISTPSDPASPLELLLAGKTDLAISYEPELLLARDKGEQLVSVAALVQRPLTSVLSIKKGFTSTKDLEGATVGTSGIPYQSAFLKTILAGAGAPAGSATEADVGFDLVPAMVAKKVDATLGGFWNVQGVQLQQQKKDPTIIRMDQAGVPTYDELVIVARAAYLHENGETVRRFVQALMRGTNAVKANPAVGVSALQAANPALTNTKLLRAQVEQTLPTLTPANPKNPFGWQSPPQWEAFGAWMLKNGLLTRPAQDQALTNEFLPGQGI